MLDGVPIVMRGGSDASRRLAHLIDEEQHEDHRQCAKKSHRSCNCHGNKAIRERLAATSCNLSKYFSGVSRKHEVSTRLRPTIPSACSLEQGSFRRPGPPNRHSTLPRPDSFQNCLFAAKTQARVFDRETELIIIHACSSHKVIVLTDLFLQYTMHVMLQVALK